MVVDLVVDPGYEGLGVSRVGGWKAVFIVGQSGHMEPVAVSEGHHGGYTVGGRSLGLVGGWVAVGPRPVDDVHPVRQHDALSGMSDDLVVDEDDGGAEALGQIEGLHRKVKDLTYR